MSISLFNCKINISFPFVVFFITLIFIDKSRLTILGIIAAFIHEAGHLVAMKSMGYTTKEISVNFFNMNIVDHNLINKKYFDDIVILIFGPIFNLVIFLIFFIIYNSFGYKVFLYFSLENLFLAFFNLLPVYSLDGGEVLSILLNRKVNKEKSNKILTIVSILTIFPIALAGFYVLLVSKFNFSLLFISLYLIVVLITKKDEYF